MFKVRGYIVNITTIKVSVWQRHMAMRDGGIHENKSIMNKCDLDYV